MRDIDNAFGQEGPENCLNCGVELTEDNDPDGHGVCSAECTWPAIAKMADLARMDREADDAEALRLAKENIYSSGD